MNRAYASPRPKQATSPSSRFMGIPTPNMSWAGQSACPSGSNSARKFDYAFDRIAVEAGNRSRSTSSYGSPSGATIFPLLELSLKQEATGMDAGSPTTTPTFPSYAEITGNSSVSSSMATAWNETKSATTSTSRREQGFWIKYNSDGGGYTCLPAFTGPSVGPDETGAADPGTKPADSGTTYTVGLFHTHTPMTHRTGGARGVGPSGADNRFHTSNNVVGVVYDYVESPAGSGTIPAGHPLDSAAQLYHSGPNRRA